MTTWPPQFYCYNPTSSTLTFPLKALILLINKLKNILL